MTLSLAQTILATAQCMTNEDAIDFIEEHISPGDLVEMLDDSTEIPIIPGCGYTKSIRFGKRFWDAKEDEDGQGI